MRMSDKCDQGSGDQVHLDGGSRCCSKDFTYVCVQKGRAHVLFTESVTNHAINWPVNICISFCTTFRFILFSFFPFFVGSFYHFSLKCLLYIPLRLLFLHSLLVQFLPLSSTPFISKVHCSWFSFFTDQTRFLRPSTIFSQHL
jgi:hypothetical protein